MNSETKKSHILVIDDDVDLLECLEEMLDSEGWSSTSFTSGLDAIEYIENKEPVDLILSDIKMPIMDGIELTKKLKKLCPEIPIILMTGHLHAVPEEIETMDIDFILKPIDMDILTKHLEKALK